MQTMTTPVNGTSAFLFSLAKRNVTVVCIKQRSMNTKGLWLGENPLDAVGTTFLLQLSMASFLTSFCKCILKPLGQVNFVGQILGGILGGPTVFGHAKNFRRLFIDKGRYILETLASFGCMFFLFLVGVKTDLGIIRKSGKKEWLIGVSTFMIPFMITVPVAHLLMKSVKLEDDVASSLEFVAVMQCTTTFHGIACFLEDLKLLNSDLGRVAMSASTISGLLGYTVLITSFGIKQTEMRGDGPGTFALMFVSAVAQALLAKVAVNPALQWVNRQTPDGQHVKEIYHVSIFLVVIGSAFVSELFGQHGFFGPMVLGLHVPDGTPVAFTLIDKLDCFVSLILLPLYFLLCGAKTNLFAVTPKTFAVIHFLAALGAFSKFIATILPSYFICGMKLKNAVTLGLILSTIGILDIQFYNRASYTGFLGDQMFGVMCVAGMIITAVISPFVKARYDPSARYMVHKKRTIEHSIHDEFCLLVGIHNPENVPNIINLLEISNPTRESPINVYVVQLNELIGRASPLLVTHTSFKKISSHRRTPSDSIINAFNMYERNNQSLVNVQPMTVVAPYVTMHDDICTLALDNRVSFIILPFHKQWSNDGTIIESTKHRSFNLKVLEKAPCSVGIFIDRGKSHVSKSVLGSWSLYRVGLFFIGGPDDREAVAYAMRMASHPSVTLTIVRFVAFGPKTDDMEDKKTDNEMINKFRLQHVGNDRVLYQEEIVADGVGTVGVLRQMENSFDVVLVGRRHSRDSPILSGLTEWNEFPELGFMADMFASKDFKGKVSVLVIQQHELVEEDNNDGGSCHEEAILKRDDSFTSSQRFYRDISWSESREIERGLASLSRYK